MQTMAGPMEAFGLKDDRVRPAAVAGRFYPSDPKRCALRARQFVSFQAPGDCDPRWIGGVVPHAGWICSGAIAGEVIGALARSAEARGRQPEVVVVFGAIHSPWAHQVGALDSHRHWRLPDGRIELPEALQARLVRDASQWFAIDEQVHRHEHAVEVEVPLIRAAMPNAALLPIETPVIDEAPRIGQQTARAIAAAGLNAIYLASSDLTHYGPDYGFTPAGTGPSALDWAMGNDRRLLELIENYRTEQIVGEVRRSQNACGAGAIAAMLGACREAGAVAGRVLRHTNSVQTLAEVAPQANENAVGYAGVVVG